MLRELRSGDTALKSPESLRWNPVLKRFGVGARGEDDDDADALDAGAASREDAPRPRLPTKENPVPVAVYGQICLASKSYQSAICEWVIILLCDGTDVRVVYLLHAYDYCPHDPVICLSLAIASIGRAMQRQADNRHHLIAQVRHARSIFVLS